MKAELRFEPWASWAALALYVALIFFLSSRSVPDSPLMFPYWDKVAHLIEYGLLGFLSQRAARLTWPASRRTAWRLGIVLACGLCIALLDEWFQSTVVDRVPSFADLAVNLLGLSLGLILNLPHKARKAS